MKALGSWQFVLFLVAVAWARDAQDSAGLDVRLRPAPVSVACGHAWLSVTVPAALLGSHVARGELRLGASCGVTAADGDGYRLQHPLVACGTTLELLPDSIRYSNVLHYRPRAGGLVARASPFSLPVDCYYPRSGSVSSGAIQPAWVSFGSTVAHRRRLRFALDAYDSSWSSRLPQPLTYSRGELMNVEAAVSTHLPSPPRVFVDECVVSPSTAEGPRYRIIANGGCLLNGQRGRSRFLPQRGDGSLRFQLDTLLFPNASGSQIYLRCHLKAVAEGTGGTLGKACSYDPVAAAWSSLDGAKCSCCGSPAGCGQRRRRQLAGTGGLLGEASVFLGPLGLLSALPGSSLSPHLPTTLEPGTAPPRHPSVPIMRGEKRDAGPALPVPGTALATVAVSSVLLAVAVAGCYCSVRRHRAGGPRAPSGEPRAVAMAPTETCGTPPVPAAPARA